MNPNPLTLEQLEHSIPDEWNAQAEEAAQTLVKDAVRQLTTVSALRGLAAIWESEAAGKKYCATMLCQAYPNDINVNDDLCYSLREAVMTYKILTRAVGLLGLPSTDDYLARKPGETPYEYISRTEKLRRLK